MTSMTRRAVRRLAAIALALRCSLPAIALPVLVMSVLVTPTMPADAAEPVATGERLVWFGTYTNAAAGRPGSEGIYVSRFDVATGRLTPPVLAGQAKNPSFVAFHPTLPMLYAVSEVSDADGKPTGGVIAFAVDEQTGTLTRKSQQPSGGKGPCHVSVDRGGRVVLAANYGGGSAICLGLQPDGGLAPVVAGSPGGFIQHEGKSVNAQRQEGPHGHSINPSPDGRFAIVCDLGLDKVFAHALDTGRAVLAPHRFGSTAPGAGPRHFAFHPGGRHGYSVNELDLTVTAFAFDPAAGTLTPFQSLSTLPADVVERKGFSTAEIVAHPGGRFVYASNRGHDSIAIYSADAQTGRLEFLGVEPIRGQTPRNFCIDPTGRFLLAAGQHSDTVTVFAIDAETGRLAFTGQSIQVPSPVCIRFRPVPPR